MGNELTKFVGHAKISMELHGSYDLSNEVSSSEQLRVCFIFSLNMRTSSV